MKSNILWIVLLCTFLPAVKVQAQSLYAVSFDEKEKNASLIVEGKVESQHSFWNKEHTMIFTANRVKLYKVFKGSVSEDYIDVLTQGGSVEGNSVDVSDLLQLQVGTIGVFFCMPNTFKLLSPLSNQLLYDVYASAQGCYKYDLRYMAASDPFERFASITTDLYPAITKLTRVPFVNKEPSVSFEKPHAAADVPGIISFTPQVVNAGALRSPDVNLLTISGSGFGSKTGNAAVLFDDANNAPDATPFTVAAASPLITSWTDTEIKVRVPTQAGTGTIAVQTSDGTQYPSITPLSVNYSITTGSFSNGNYINESNLMSANGAGGYDIKYSTNTANSGRDMSTAPEKAPFERALTTWREVGGANLRLAGNTTNQKISDDNENLVVFDNTQTTKPLLAAGTLAIAYSYNTTCLPAGQYAVFKKGFDVLLRNNGVSIGTTRYTVGPCPPATSGVIEYDLEMTMLHELGHVLNLGHISDTWQGSPLPNMNPGKVMNYVIANGLKRTSPDNSAKTGVQYAIRQDGPSFGSCINNIGITGEMVPLTTTLEAKDECPLNFPVNTTIQNTQLTFDLGHATSNTNSDPQYTAVKCNGIGTGVTNTAFASIKTGHAGTLTIAVSGYGTTPSNQEACTNGGVELAVYKVNSCPSGQNFPAPVACRTFNANGVLAAITGLDANTTYLFMVDGISNTKASFTLTLNGTVLPVKIRDFNGNISGSGNVINWLFDAFNNVAGVSLERSSNGLLFEEVKSWNSADFALQGNYTDHQAPPVSYYRLKFTSQDGKVEYSNIISLVYKSRQAWSVYPNPTKGDINLYVKGVTGKFVAKVYNTGGALVARRPVEINRGSQRLVIPVGSLAAGNYKVIVTGSNGGNVYRGNVSIIK